VGCGIRLSDVPSAIIIKFVYLYQQRSFTRRVLQDEWELETKKQPAPASPSLCIAQRGGGGGPTRPETSQRCSCVWLSANEREDLFRSLSYIHRAQHLYIETCLFLSHGNFAHQFQQRQAHIHT